MFFRYPYYFQMSILFSNLLFSDDDSGSDKVASSSEFEAVSGSRDCSGDYTPKKVGGDLASDAHDNHSIICM